jgi:hypothetical protein
VLWVAFNTPLIKSNKKATFLGGFFYACNLSGCLICQAFLFMSFTVDVWLGIAVFAPRARYSFATAQKSTQKRPPRQLRPKKQGSHLAGGVLMLLQNSQKTLKQLAQKAHENASG